MAKLKDIANEARVTVSTVSAALNGTGRISEKRRGEIVAIAEKMGYRPNLAAKLLKSHENNMLGLVICDNTQSFAGHGVYSGVMAEFLRECGELDYRPHFEIYDHDSDDLPSMFTDGLAAGCLFCGFLNETVRNWLADHPEFPIVAFGEPHDYSVRSDNATGIYNAIQHLAATGHKRVNVICGPGQFDVHRQTITGFESAATDFGLDLSGKTVYEQTVVTGKEHDQENIGFLDEIFNGENVPDALLLSGRHLTTTAIYHLQRNGIRVPEDVSIISVMSDWEARAICPGITSIQRDIAGMTNQALRMLAQRIRGKEVREPQQWTEAKLVPLNTVQSRRM